MRTYTKNYDGEITPQILQSESLACPQCGQTMIVITSSIEWSDDLDQTKNCVRIKNVPGYYCEATCDVFITSCETDLIVAREVLLVANSFGISSIAEVAYYQAQDLIKYLRGKPKRTKKPPEE